MPTSGVPKRANCDQALVSAEVSQLEKRRLPLAIKPCLGVKTRTRRNEYPHLMTPSSAWLGGFVIGEGDQSLPQRSSGVDRVHRETVGYAPQRRCLPSKTAQTPPGGGLEVAVDMSDRELRARYLIRQWLGLNSQRKTQHKAA